MADSTVGTVFAWNVHMAQEEWASRADVKASVALAFEGGLAVVMVTASDVAAPLRGHQLAPRLIGLFGVVLVLVGVVAAGLAVVPVLRRSDTLRGEAGDHLIYFGHLRHISRDDLTRRLCDLGADQELAMLSQQIAVISRLNWWKHRLLQISIMSALLALLALAISMLTYALG